MTNAERQPLRCARFVYAWKVLSVEFLIFFEVYEGEQSHNFPKTPLHSLSHTAHSFVKSALLASQESSAIRLKQEGPQRVGRVPVDAVVMPLYKLLQLRVRLAASEVT